MNHRTLLLALALVSLAVAGLDYGLGTPDVATPPQPESAPSSSTGPDAPDTTAGPDGPDGPDTTAGPDGASAAVSQPPPEAASLPDERVNALAAEAEAEPTLRMRVVRIEACGSTCRDVTANLHNDGTLDLTNVEVYTTIYAGEQIVWVDAERVGTVAAGDSYTTTKRVKLGAGDVLKIHSNGGEVTVKTVLEFDQGSEVVTEQIEVV